MSLHPVRVDSFTNAKLTAPERCIVVYLLYFNRVPRHVVRVDSFVNAKLILPERYIVYLVLYSTEYLGA